MFYQKNWNLVKHDVMAHFQDFHNGDLDIFRLNFAVLLLIPKEPDALVMKKFRPISLLNCIFKVFNKVLTNRLALLMNILTSPNQTTFIKGRYILESVVSAHKTIHSIIKKGQKGPFLSLIMKKLSTKLI
jgi:hypothetical protein